MLDVLVAGAGPAGAMAALVLARAGARVVIVDRDEFPRDKLCGDTLNPGAVALLASFGLAGGPLTRARPLSGMRISGPRVQVTAHYTAGQTGLALLRRDLDAWLLEHAVRAGARFEPGLVVRAPLLGWTTHRTIVRGLSLERRQSKAPIRLPASMTIAADGRRSVLARAFKLTAHPPRPRRWAFGTYATNVAGMTDVGEMHIRPSYYLGLAPITGDLVNVCVVTGPRPDGRTPNEIVRRAVAGAPEIAARLEQATFAGQVGVLGPLAVDARAAGVDGMLLAGDAAGFVDPMTGDGIHLALRGAVLAAQETLRVLETGDLTGAADRLLASRQHELANKVRFNRTLRRLVASPVAIGAAEWGARLAPSILRRLVNIAGDAA